MKFLYALVLGLALLPACCYKKKKCCDAGETHEYVEERISGVENALDLK